VDATGIIDALAGSGSAAAIRRSRARTSRVATPSSTSPRRRRLHAAGHAYYCDLTSEQVQERAKASGKPGYDGYSRDRGLAAARARVCGSESRGARRSCTTAVRGEVVFDNATIEDFVLLRGNGSPVFLIANVVDDIEMRISHVVRAEEHLRTRRSSRCCGRRSATHRRYGRTCRSS
jgi:glutamyl-tRNA synthetase